MYKPLKPEVKALWLQALLSGAYKQGRYYLNRPEGYCCLGVICDISGFGEWKDLWKDGHLWFSDGAASDRSYPLASVEAWAGLDREARAILTSMNDASKSFEEIAHWIDENL